MPRNPPAPVTTKDKVDTAIVDTRQFFRDHDSFVFYVVIASIVTGTLVLTGDLTPLFLLGLSLGGAALVLHAIIKPR